MTDGSASFVPSTLREESYTPDAAAAIELKREAVRLTLMQDAEEARKILRGLDATLEGWCQLCTHTPSRPGGYIQISALGANKFCYLQELVMWGSGRWNGAGDQSSHRCGRPTCKALGHVVPETVSNNLSRRGCLVWVPCAHGQCPKKILLCSHRPVCIKFANGYRNMEDLIRRGVMKLEIIIDFAEHLWCLSKLQCN